MAKSSKYDWDTIKTEYITTRISYRKLAAKYGVALRTIEDKARKELWTADRDEYVGKTVVATVKRVSKRVAMSNANKLVKLQSAADRMADVIDKVFDDTDQFHRHIIQTRDGDVWDADERILEKIDTKAIKDLTGALKDLAAVMRNVYDIPTQAEKSAMDIAAERLQIDKQRADMDDDDSHDTGVIEIAAVVLEADEDAEED